MREWTQWMMASSSSRVGHLRAARHEAADVPSAEVLGDASSDHLAKAEERVAVSDQLRMDFVVGDEDDCDIPAPSNPLDGLEHLKLLLLPEGGGRFVENEHPRSEENGASDGEGLPLSAGHRSHRLLRIGDADADPGHLLLGDAVHFRGLHEPEGPGAPCDFPPHEEIAGHRGERIEGQILVHGADSCIGCRQGVRNKTGWPSR